MELIDQPLSSAIVAESLNLSKTPVAQDGVTDKCNPVFQLQGQLEDETGLDLLNQVKELRVILPEKGETQ